MALVTVGALFIIFMIINYWVYFSTCASSMLRLGLPKCYFKHVKKFVELL